VILSEDERTITWNAIQHWEGKRWRVYASVVMPDHIHLLVQPLPLENDRFACHELGTILHSVKSFSAHQINKCRHRSGSVWQDERYDRIVRNDAELLEKWQYIRDNPVKQALATTPEDYPWYRQLSEHRPEAGATTTNTVPVKRDSD
jgi:REP element-mobilizing transposase RayT